MFQAATDKATAAQSSIQPQPQMSSASIIDHHIQQGAAAVASSQLPSPAIRASSSNNNNFNPNSFNPHLQHNNPVTFEVVPSSSGMVSNLSYLKKARVLAGNKAAMLLALPWERTHKDDYNNTP